ncbi:MAG: polymer-forming cytoskeletal protein [Planctomycetaceae bacterium]|nr:polymer-forming cytoskeletal protein [Planctomycetaceae bacterium]MCB9949443.1 polymer-forming cytoskeletal protein [Planctomycetaceae bacterium]
MFGSRKKTPPAPQEPVAAKPAPQPQPAAQVPKNYISAGTVIEGNIVSHEDLHLEGTVKGDIKTSARLILGKDSVVEGNILASEAEAAGKITGTLESTGLLTIRSTCVIDGDIITKSLNVESGSSFNGRCKVGEAAESARPKQNRLPATAGERPQTVPAPK